MRRRVRGICGPAARLNQKTAEFAQATEAMARGRPGSNRRRRATIRQSRESFPLESQAEGPIRGTTPLSIAGGVLRDPVVFFLLPLAPLHPGSSPPANRCPDLTGDPSPARVRAAVGNRLRPVGGKASPTRVRAAAWPASVVARPHNPAAARKHPRHERPGRPLGILPRPPSGSMSHRPEGLRPPVPVPAPYRHPCLHAGTGDAGAEHPCRQTPHRWGRG